MRVYHRETRRYTFDDVWEIYALVDPRTKKPRYVGCTRCGLTRLSQHTVEARSRAHGNERVGRWLRRLDKLGLCPEFRVLEIQTTLAGAQRAEFKWIRVFGELNINGNPKLIDRKRKPWRWADLLKRGKVKHWNPR